MTTLVNIVICLVLGSAWLGSIRGWREGKHRIEMCQAEGHQWCPHCTRCHRCNRRRPGG